MIIANLLNYLHKRGLQCLMLMATFICAHCHADNQNPQISFSAKSQFDDKINSVGILAPLYFGGIEIRLTDVDLYHSIDRVQQSQITLRPEISIFAYQGEKPEHDNSIFSVLSIKNVEAAVFRVTVKGYSVYEFNGRNAQGFSLDRIENKAFRKPEIMFSYIKHF